MIYLITTLLLDIKIVCFLIGKLFFFFYFSQKKGRGQLVKKKFHFSQLVSMMVEGILGSSCL